MNQSYSQEDLLRAALKFQDVLTAYAYSILLDWALAQDAVQESMITVHQKWSSFKPDLEVFPWVRQIVRNHSLMIIRARKRQVYTSNDVLLGVLDRQFDAYVTEHSINELTLRKQALATCMEKLEDQSRTLLLKFYRDRRSCTDLAVENNKTENAIRMKMFKLRKILRRCVNNKLQILEHA